MLHRDVRSPLVPARGYEWKKQREEGEGKKKIKNIWNLCFAGILGTVLKGRRHRTSLAPRMIGLHPNRIPWTVQRPLRFTQLSKEARDSKSSAQVSLCVPALRALGCSSPPVISTRAHRHQELVGIKRWFWNSRAWREIRRISCLSNSNTFHLDTRYRSP